MKNTGSTKVLFIVFFIFFPLGFILNAPVENTLNDLINKNTPKSCKSSTPIFSLSYFPIPHIKAKNFNVSSSCSTLKDDILIKKIELVSRGLSFSPIGLKFKVNIQFKDNKKTDFFVSLNSSSQKILFDQTIIPVSILNSIQKNPLRLNGTLKVDMITRLTNGKLQDLNFNITSNNLILPEQNISGFTIPKLKLTPLILKGDLKEKNTFNLQSIEVGKGKDSFKFKGKGNINNFSKINRGTLKFLGKLSLLGEIKNQFSFLELVMGPPNKDGNFEFEINGPLQSLKFKSLNK